MKNKEIYRGEVRGGGDGGVEVEEEGRERQRGERGNELNKHLQRKDFFRVFWFRIIRVGIDG